MRRVRVDHLVFISEFVMEEARQKFPSLGTSSVIYSAADEAIFYPVAAGSKNATPTVLFAGRLVEEKGVHILLEAMKLLEQQEVRVEAQIVGSSGFGDGTDTPYIRQLKAKSPPSVRFCAYRSGAALGDLFRNADIFCSPSVWEEPFGMVNVEAMASGLPVVSTRGGGARRYLPAGEGFWWSADRPFSLPRHCGSWPRTHNCGRALDGRALLSFASASRGRPRASGCNRFRKHFPSRRRGWIARAPYGGETQWS